MKNFKLIPFCFLAMFLFTVVSCEKEAVLSDGEVTHIEKKRDPKEEVVMAGEECIALELSAEGIDVVSSPYYEAGTFGLLITVHDYCDDLYVELVDADGNVLLDDSGDPLFSEPLLFAGETFEYHTEECIDVYVVVHSLTSGTSSAVVGPFNLGYTFIKSCNQVGVVEDNPDWGDITPTPWCVPSGCANLFTVTDITTLPYGSPTALITFDINDDSCFNPFTPGLMYHCTHNNGVTVNEFQADFDANEIPYSFTECGLWKIQLINPATGQVLATMCVTVGQGSLSC